MRDYRWKKIWLNEKKTKYCIVKVFDDQTKMRQYYYDYDCQNGGPLDKYHFEIRGVSLHYRWVKGNKCHAETGTVLFYKKDCGAGVVSHELLHAVLWAYKHHRSKKQYPIIIKNMKEEEVINYNLTFAVVQFYQWYYKVIDK